MPPTRQNPRYFCQFCGYGTQTAPGLTKHLTWSVECSRRKGLLEKHLREEKLAVSLSQTDPNSDLDSETPADDWVEPVVVNANPNMPLNAQEQMRLDPMLDAVDDIDDFEPKEFEETHLWEPAETTMEGAVDNDGQSSTCQNSELRQIRYIYHNYPGKAGASVGLGIPRFESFMSASANPLPTSSSPQPPKSVFQDPKLWELVRWLMSSGLSARARDEYFKLKCVSHFLNI